MRSLLLTAAILTITVVFPSLAKAAGLVLIPLGQLDETLRQSVDVSGPDYSLIGLRRGDAIGALTVNNLSVGVSAGIKGQLCFSMSTRDGRYTGARDFSVSAPEGGVAPLDMKSHYESDLRAYNAQDIALRAEVRTDCDSGSSGILVPTTFSLYDHSTLLVVDLATGSSSPDIALVSASGLSLAHVQCSEIINGARTAYDHECNLQVPASVWISTATIRVDIVGVTGSEREEDYSVNLGPL